MCRNVFYNERFQCTLFPQNKRHTPTSEHFLNAWFVPSTKHDSSCSPPPEGFLHSSRLPYPARALAPCQSSVWNHITLVCARSSADVGGDAAVICKKKWHNPFLKATGFFFPFQEFVFFYKCCDWALPWHKPTRQGIFLTLFNNSLWSFIHLLFLNLKEWIRLERGNMGKVDVATVWSVPFSPGPVLVVSRRGAVVGVSHAREDSLRWIIQSFVREGSRTSSSSSTLPSLPHPHVFFLPLLPPWFCRGPHAG